MPHSHFHGRRIVEGHSPGLFILFFEMCISSLRDVPSYADISARSFKFPENGPQPHRTTKGIDPLGGLNVLVSPASKLMLDCAVVEDLLLILRDPLFLGLGRQKVDELHVFGIKI